MASPQETVLKNIAAELFKRYPDARWGPGHVVLEDSNWDLYAQAIEMTNILLAYRSLKALGESDMAEKPRGWFELYGLNVDDYTDHSIAELGATLAALELVRWHEQGHQGDAPKA